MKNFLLASASAIAIFAIFGVGHANATCPVPNPNNLAPPFVDGCALPAVALNKLAAQTQQSCAQVNGYGGDPTGVADNKAALTAALAASAAATPNHICAQFGPGKYTFTSTFTFTYPSNPYASVTITGAGADVTEIVETGGVNLFVLNMASLVAQPIGYQSIHMASMAMETSTVNLGDAVTVNGSTTTNTVPGYSAQSDFTNMSFYGTDRTNIPPGVKYWHDGIVLNSVSTVNFYGIYMQGINPIATSGSQPVEPTGVTLNGGANPANQYQFVNCSFQLLGTGVLIESAIQGISFTNDQFVGDIVGIIADGANVDVLTVTNSAFNSNTAVLLNSPSMADFQFVNNTVYVGPFGGNGPASFVGVNITTGSNVVEAVINDNIFNGQGPNVAGTEVNINTNVEGGTITGNIFGNFVNSGGNMFGIVLGAASSGVTVGDNKYIGLQTILSNGGSANVIKDNTFGNAPSIVADGHCGTSPTMATGSNDLRGSITVGTSTNNGFCDINFGNTWSHLYGCFANNETAAARAVEATSYGIGSASSFGITAIAGTLNAGDVLSYTCHGYQ